MKLQTFRYPIISAGLNPVGWFAFLRISTESTTITTKDDLKRSNNLRWLRACSDLPFQFEKVELIKTLGVAMSKHPLFFKNISYFIKICNLSF